MMFMFQQNQVPTDPFRYQVFHLSGLKEYDQVKGIKDNLQHKQMMYQMRLQGAKDLAKALSNCSKLTQLDLNLNNQQIQQEGVDAIGKSLRQGQKLEKLILHLKWDLGAITEIDQENQIALAIQYNSHTLTSLEIDIGDNKIGDSYCFTLLDSMMQCKQLTNLGIGLKKNLIDESISRKFKSITDLSNLTRLSLDLSYNELLLSGHSSITQYISELRQLEDLSLSYENNRMKPKEVLIVSESISRLTNLKQLKLNLKYNTITNDSASNLSTSLVKLSQLESLQLELGWTELSQVGFYTLLSGLSKCQQLSRLTFDAKWNKIGEAEETDMSFVYDPSSKLQSLTLYLIHNSLNSTGLQKIIKNLSKFVSLQQLELYCQSNELESELDTLGQCLSLNLQAPKLKLNLQSNNISNQRILEFLEAFSKCETIGQLALEINENNINTECYESIGSFLANFKNLNKLSLLMFENQQHEAKDIPQILQLFKKILKSKSINYLESKINYYSFSIHYKQIIEVLKRGNRIVKYHLYN